MDAITPQDADQIIESKLRPLPAERVPFNKAYGRILREPVLADRDFPPFDRVMMDGIAIAYDSADRNREFASEGIQRAGIPAMELKNAAGCIRGHDWRC